MTAVAEPNFTRTQPRTAAQRIGNVVKLHMANPWTAIFNPLIILAIVFFVNYSIMYIAHNDWSEDGGSPAEFNNGASAFVAIYTLVVAVQAMNATFPFALGYGVTRRDFYLGSSVLFVALAVGWAALLGVLAEIERATEGWGIGGVLFRTPGAPENGLAGTIYLQFVTILLFIFMGAAVAGVYVRWRANGMYVFFGALVLLNVAAAWVISLTGNWGAVGRVFADLGLMGTATASLLITGLFAVAGYFILRRATPRS